MDLISVCICTYKRQEMLQGLVQSLQEQNTKGRFAFQLVIVDNDSQGSARFLVTDAQKSSQIRIIYKIEPEQNISLARNMALALTEADYYACIDDDEFAEKTWLYNLYFKMIEFKADGVLGPVRPFYECPPPRWLAKGNIIERKEFPTGTVMIEPKHMRTGNVIFSKKIIDENPFPFKYEYGRTGGEDHDFFRRMIISGYKFYWCNDAVVFEIIPKSRMTKTYHIKRALLRGVVHSKRSPLFSLDTFISIAACMVYTLILPIVYVFCNRLFASILIRNCDHIGKILARFGIRVVKQRNE